MSADDVYSAFLAILVATILVAVGAVPAAAQETIFDPENPGLADDEAQEDGDDEGSEKPDEGDEALIIDDPERPDDLPDPTAEQGAPRHAVGLSETELTVDYEVAALFAPPVGPEGMDAMELAGGMGIDLRHDVSPRTRAVVAGRFRYWAGSGRHFDEWRTHFEPRLDRAYVLHRPGSWSLSLGQMRNSWGSTDIIRPGDVIDPVDLRDPLASGSFGAPMAQFSANAAYSGDDWSIRAVLVPFFQPNQVALFGRDTALANERNPLVAEQLPFLLLAEQLIEPGAQQYSQPFLLSMSRPRDLPKNASAGLRATSTVASTDLGAGFFFGWDRTPWVVLDEDLRALLNLIAEDGQIFDDYDFFGFVQRNPEAIDHGQNLSDKAEEGETIFDTEYRRRTTFLIDAARYVGPIGVRADVAFSPRRVFYTTDFEPVLRASAFSALGLSYERLLGGERPLAVTVEGFWLHPFRVGSAVHNALVPDEEGGDDDDELLLFHGGYYGVAGALNWHLGIWDLELNLGGLASISPGDFIGRIEVSRPWFPGLRTTLGASVFFGPDPEETLSAGGLWAHSDRIYLTVGSRF